MKSLNPNHMCATCAFRKDGAGAAAEPDNALKGEIAALGAVPFLCHHAPDGRELAWREGPIEFFRSMRERKDRRTCAGWKAAVKKHARAGLFHNGTRRIRRALAQYGMKMLDRFIGSKTKASKKHAQGELERTLKLLKPGRKVSAIRTRGTANAETK